MSARKAKRRPAVRRDPIVYFTQEISGLPIGGLPDPLPCPHCGGHEVHIDFEKGESNGVHWRTAHAVCGSCGARGSWVPKNDEWPTDYAMATEAARMWNTRKGGAS